MTPFPNSFNTMPRAPLAGDTYHRPDLCCGTGATYQMCHLLNGRWPRSLAASASLPVPQLSTGLSLRVTLPSVSLWMFCFHLSCSPWASSLSLALLSSCFLLFSASFISLFFFSTSEPFCLFLSVSLPVFPLLTSLPSPLSRQVSWGIPSPLGLCSLSLLLMFFIFLSVSL